MKILSLIVGILFQQILFSQIDFENYTTVQAEGPMPDDFSISIQDRLKKEMEKDYDMTSRQKEYFVKNKAFAIDNILHSGLVIYGDPITKYVEDVAKKVLKDDTQLFSELRFFTLRSNSTNAFVTGEGMVFVTMGLLSQLISESDLALVLSHEIAHYEENHILKSFENTISVVKNRQTKFDDKIEELSDYSKNHELEADELGIKRYLEAGYPRENVKQVFDILMYSHLPIDELETKEDYLAGDLAFIPNEFFPTEPNPIKVDEDYDDKTSSHPNIKNRKENAQTVLDENKSAGGSNEYQLGKDRFLEIRNIARFERVQNWIYANQYVDCLYEISILERDYPNNKHLQICKAQAWCGISVYSAEKKLSECYTKPKKVEGESYTIHYVFDNLKGEDIRTLALRNILDIKAQLPNEEELEEMERIATRQLLKTKVDWDEFSTLTFQEALDKVTVNETSTDTTNAESNIIDENSEEWKNLSKYEKIKLKEQASGTISDDTDLKVKVDFDSTDFRFYALSDFVNVDPIFKEESKLYKEKIEKEEALEDELNKLSRNEKRKRLQEEEKKELNLGITDVVFVEPLAAQYKRSSYNPEKSADLQVKFVDAIDKSSEKLGVSTTQLSKFKMSELGTEGYNERAALQRYLNQFANVESEDIFIADYKEVKKITERYNTENIIFSLVEYNFNPDLNPLVMIGLGVYFFPALALYIPAKLATASEVKMSILVFNAKKGKVETYTSYNFNQKPTKTVMQLHTYDLLMQLSTPK